MINTYEIHPNTFDDKERATFNPYMVVIRLGDGTWDPCASFAAEFEARIFIRGARCAETYASVRAEARRWEMASRGVSVI